MASSVETHCVDIIPPNERRRTWMAVCSFKDYSRSFRNRVEAITEANNHITTKVLVNDLTQGVYQFDDGEG